MKNNGQITLEFMFLLIIMLLYVQLIIVPNINTSVHAAWDVTRFGEGVFAAQKIVNAANYAAISSNDSRQTISIFVPQNTSLECFDTAASTPAAPSLRLTYIVESDTEPAPCKATGGAMECVKTLILPLTVPIECDNFTNISNGNNTVLSEIVVSRVSDTIELVT